MGHGRPGVSSVANGRKPAEATMVTNQFGAVRFAGSPACRVPGVTVPSPTADAIRYPQWTTAETASDPSRCSSCRQSTETRGWPEGTASLR